MAMNNNSSDWACERVRRSFLRRLQRLPEHDFSGSVLFQFAIWLAYVAARGEEIVASTQQVGDLIMKPSSSRLIAKSR
jgi:hypothetical protein